MGLVAGINEKEKTWRKEGIILETKLSIPKVAMETLLSWLQQPWHIGNMPVLAPLHLFVCVWVCVCSFLCTLPNCSFCSFILSICLVVNFNSFFFLCLFSPDATNRLPCCVLCFVMHKIFTNPPGVVFHTSLSVVEACLKIDYGSGAVERNRWK